MKLYGITGKMRAGKDTFFSIVAERIPARRIAFADELKSECASACGVTVEQINADKARFRPLLQWWGTEFRRNLDSDYWLKKMLAALDALPECGAVFVTDVRFENEAQLIRSRGGEIIRVIRTNHHESGGLVGHASEIEMEGIMADYTVAAENVQELRDAVNHWLNRTQSK